MYYIYLSLLSSASPKARDGRRSSHFMFSSRFQVSGGGEGGGGGGGGGVVKNKQISFHILEMGGGGGVSF